MVIFNLKSIVSQTTSGTYIILLLIVHYKCNMIKVNLLSQGNEFNIFTLFTQQQQCEHFLLETFLEVLAKNNFQS
jgi:hypothetical protein